MGTRCIFNLYIFNLCIFNLYTSTWYSLTDPKDLICRQALDKEPEFVNTRAIILRGSCGRFFLLNLGGRSAGSFTVGLENGQKTLVDNGNSLDNGTKTFGYAAGGVFTINGFLGPFRMSL